MHVVEDSVNYAIEMNFQVTALNNSTATQISFPADCEVMLVRHVDATDVVWLGLTNSITAGGAGTWPLRPEDPPLRIRVNEETEIYGITANGNVDLHIAGMVRI